MSEKDEAGWFERVGSRVSEWVADLAAHPYAQIGVIVVCGAWFAGGFATDLLTAILSILAITLTQMVLNNQAARDIDIHRRDVAMHAKLDELIAVSRRAKNDFVAIEDRDEEEIVQLKDEVKEAIEGHPDAAADPDVQGIAKRMVDQATKHVDRGRQRNQAGAKRRAGGPKRKAAKR